MQTKFAVLMAGALLVNGAFAQQEGEPVNGPDQVPLGGFDGCFVQEARNGCSARITCNGVGIVFGNTGPELQLATQEANMKARGKLAEFYSDKVKAETALKSTSKNTAKSNANGGLDTTSEMTRLMASVNTSSADAVLSGVQVLGRKVDINQRTVTVKIGVSCKSQAAAAKSQQTAAGSAQPGGNAPAPQEGGQPAGPATSNMGAMKQYNMNQKRKNADDF